MVFPPINPVYLDPPNWAQPPNSQQAGLSSSNNENPQLPNLLQPPSAVGSSGGNHVSVRPNSMVDRAKMAKIPQPEASLKCPRCESTNTKFCYYNNYSLSQPRHFCKTCRRYWTSGGALRNVPVGGGCRRNKRSSRKSSRSKSPSRIQHQAATSNFTASSSSTICTPDGMMSHLPRHTPSLHLPYLSPFHNISDLVTGDMQLDFGLTRAPMAAASGNNGGTDMKFQNGTCSDTGQCRPILSNGFTERWRSTQMEQVHDPLPQHGLPILSNILEPSIGLFHYEGQNIESPSFLEKGSDLRLNKSTLDSSASQQAMVKLEENQTLRLPKGNNTLLGGSSASDQVWIGSNSWSDLPGFTTSTSHLL